MSTINYCRLCVNIGLDFKSLYDETGQPTEVYDLTAKYFDQSILNTEDAKHLSMICLQCWEHIWDFNNFQQAVLVAQSNLDAIKHTDILPISGELPGTNVLKDLQQQTSLAKEKNEDCIYLSESEESAPPTTEEFLNPNHIVAIGANPQDATNVDLTLDEDDMHQEEEFSDAVGFLTGGEYGNRSDFTTQTLTESIDLDSDSNSALCQFSIKTSEIETKTDENLLLAHVQLSRFFNHAHESDEEFKKFAASRSFICFVCVKKLFGLKGLFIHFNMFHTGKPVQVICCQSRQKGIPSIAKHLLTHYNTPMLNPWCEVCGKSYTTKSSVKRHISKAHPDKIT